MPLATMPDSSAVLALRQSSIPALRSLVLEETNDALEIHGHLPSYYLKQLAQEAVMPSLGGRELRNRVVVVRTPEACAGRLTSMNRTKGERFAGLTVALITPFRDGEVDYVDLGRLVDWHVEQGTDCLAPVGTTGESPTLDHEEHERVIAAVVEQARGRIKVMPGTGSNSTREAIRLTKFARKAGADGALMVGPYYNKPTQEGYYRHFAAVAEAVPDLPIVLYNIPGRTGSNILPETIARLAKLPSIVAVKEATGSLDQASHIASLCDLTLAERRRQPDVAADEHRRPRRGVGGRQHRAARHEGPARHLRSRQTRRGAGLAPQAVHAVPRHAVARHQPDPGQDRHEAARAATPASCACRSVRWTRRRRGAVADATGV